MDITRYIGKAIAYYREEQGLSTVQLAIKSNLSQPSISQYENGNRKPSDNAVESIAKALGISTKTLFERAEHFARQDEKVVYNDSALDRGDRYEYERRRQIDRIYRFNDFVYELNRDVFLSINTRIHDVADLVDYGSRSNVSSARSISGFKRDRSSLISHLTEKVFADFISDHMDEISFRIEDELKQLNMDVFQFVEELRNRN